MKLTYWLVLWVLAMVVSLTVGMSIDPSKTKSAILTGLLFNVVGFTFLLAYLGYSYFSEGSQHLPPVEDLKQEDLDHYVETQEVIN